MKMTLRILLLLAIVCSAAVSVKYASDLYHTRYAPRYLKGNAC
jgi:hypothetical protein